MFKINDNYNFILHNIVPFDELYFAMDVEYSYEFHNFEQNKNLEIKQTVHQNYFKMGDFDLISKNKDMKEIDKKLYNIFSFSKKISVYPQLLRNKSIGSPTKSLVPLKISFESNDPTLFYDSQNYIDLFDYITKFSYKVIKIENNKKEKKYKLETLELNGIHDFIKIDFTAGFNEYFRQYQKQNNKIINIW